VCGEHDTFANVKHTVAEFVTEATARAFAAKKLSSHRAWGLTITHRPKPQKTFRFVAINATD